MGKSTATPVFEDLQCGFQLFRVDEILQAAGEDRHAAPGSVNNRLNLFPAIAEGLFGDGRQGPEIVLPGEDERQVAQILGFVRHRPLGHLRRPQQGVEELAAAQHLGQQ